MSEYWDPKLSADEIKMSKEGIESEKARLLKSQTELIDKREQLFEDKNTLFLISLLDDSSEEFSREELLKILKDKIIDQNILLKIDNVDDVFILEDIINSEFTRIDKEVDLIKNEIKVVEEKIKNMTEIN